MENSLARIAAVSGEYVRCESQRTRTKLFIGCSIGDSNTSREDVVEQEAARGEEY